MKRIFSEALRWCRLKPSIANLLVTLMDKMDMPVEKMGGSTGKLPIDTLSEV